MSVTSTMFTGVSGLLNQADALNVIGNNIANVNTIGFKGARTLFSDVLSTSIGNGSQVGYGVQLQKIDNLFTQGSFESTGNVTDLAIQGNSFFAVKDPNISSPVTQSNSLLSRAGAFRLDNNLTLVNSDGYQVLDTQGNPIKFNDNSASISTINAAITTQCTAPANAINIEASIQAAAATTVLANPIFVAAATAFTTQSATISGTAGTFQTTPVTAPTVATNSETTAQAAIVTAAAATVTAAATATAAPTASNVAAAQTAFDNLNSLVNSSTFTTPEVVAGFNVFKASLATTNTQNATNAPPAEIASAIAINNAAAAAQTAAITASTTPNPVTLAAANSAFTALTTLTNSSNFTSPLFIPAYTLFQTGLTTPVTGSIAMVETAMNTASPLIITAQAQLAAAQGSAFSKITSIDSSGLITYLGKDGATLNYYNTSGQVGVGANATNAVAVQRLAVVKVTNEGALEKAGGTLYKPTVDSGVSTAAFTLASNTANGSSEKINTNSLESSNVDMAAEFVNMIQTQRAYSANSKTITTADEMTQEILALKR